MISVLLFLFVGMTAAATTLVVNRKKSYHGFMVHQSNLRDDEYDRIYSLSR